MNSLCLRGVRLVEILSDLHNGLRLSLPNPLFFHISVSWSDGFLFLILLLPLSFIDVTSKKSIILPTPTQHLLGGPNRHTEVIFGLV